LFRARRKIVRSNRHVGLIRRSLTVALIAALGSVSPSASQAQSGGGAVAPLLKLLQSGRLPPERRGTVVEMICSRGGPDDLAIVLAQLAAGDFDATLQAKVVALLTDSAVVRKLQPAGDLSSIEKLLHDPKISREVRLGAIRLAAIWKVPAVVDELVVLARDETADAALRTAAIDGLASFGDAPSKATLAELAGGAKTLTVRGAAAAALARLDLDAAAQVAASAVAAARTIDDVAPLLDAFLTRRGGPDKLAAALPGVHLSADAAKLGLRYMYSVGRSDAALADVFSKAAGISAEAKPPTPEEVKELVAEVVAKGDAARGEQVFRRGDLSCLKCHAVSRAGGSVGPDLSAVGSISPVDYVANSILDPNLAIKEQYVTRVIVTDDGETFTGIVVDRDETRVRLRDAAGKIVIIPTADIDEEAEGRSLMPQGLTKFLTHQELLDLVRFISELGKPGPYAIRKTPTIQRWRVLKSPSGELSAGVPNVEVFREHVLAAPPDSWGTAYAKVDGSLPLAEVAAADGPLFVQGEVDVVEPGEVEFHVQGSQKPTVWIDAEPFEASAAKVRLDRGRHKITLRFELSRQESVHVTVELTKPSGSTAQFDVVGGN
jgi:putative heme-binding domain-containing protein